MSRACSSMGRCFFPVGWDRRPLSRGFVVGPGGVMTPSALRRAEVGEGKPRGERGTQMAPCWASLTLGRAVGTIGPGKAPLAPTRGARVRFPRWDGKGTGARGVLTSPKLGASAAEGTALALASTTLGWDGMGAPHWGPGEPGRKG